MPVEAKYNIQKFGHTVTVYEQADIPSELRLYIKGLEYDRVYGYGPGYGARLYFTNYGKLALATPTAVTKLMGVTKFIMNNPEWYRERPYLSVSTEIQYHAMWPTRWQVDIEYHCSELKFWEVPYNKYC